MAGRLGPRFGAQAAFLITAAIVFGLLEASVPAIVGGMVAAWVAVAAVELALVRRRRPTAAAAGPVPPAREPDAAPAPAVDAPGPARDRSGDDPLPREEWTKLVTSLREAAADGALPRDVDGGVRDSSRDLPPAVR